MATYATVVTLQTAPVGNVLISSRATTVNTSVDAGTMVALTAAITSAMSGVYVAQIPAVGGYSYDGSGRVTADPDGNAYTYNTDDTIHTITKGGVTRTAAYGANGIASWA